MVGVPKSNGCATCRQRRIKCDEIVPACTQCTRGDRQCPGYQPRLKFQDEGPSLERRYRKKREQSKSRSSSRNSNRTSTPESPEEGSTGKVLVVGISSPTKSPLPSYISIPETSNDQSTIYPTTCLPMPIMESIIGTSFETPSLYPSLSFPKGTEALHLLHDFAFINGALFPRSEPRGFVERFMAYIPERMGRSTALDDAVVCLSTAQIAYLSKDTMLGRKGLSHYTRALGSLQKALYDKVEGKSEETLCATLLLAQFELIASHHDKIGKSAWIKHAGGAARLVQLRGPEKHKNGFAKAMLLASKGPCFSEALVSRRHCFLADPEWTALTYADDGTDVPRNQEEDLRSEFFDIMCVLPGLLKDTNDLLPKYTRGSSQVLSVLKRAEENNIVLRGWYARFISNTHQLNPHPSPRAGSDGIFPQVYDYSNNITAMLTCLHASSLILSNMIISCLRFSNEPNAENIGLVRTICMSFDYTLQFLPFGGMYMHFALRVASTACVDDEHWQLKVWVLDALNRFAGLHPTGEMYRMNMRQLHAFKLLLGLVGMV